MTFSSWLFRTLILIGDQYKEFIIFCTYLLNYKILQIYIILNSLNFLMFGLLGILKKASSIIKAITVFVSVDAPACLVQGYFVVQKYGHFGSK